MSDQIEHDPNEKPSKYPRKVFFGLITDYGPPKQTAYDWIGYVFFAAVMNFAVNGFPQKGPDRSEWQVIATIGGIVLFIWFVKRLRKTGKPLSWRLGRMTRLLIGR
jgi:hypothetical protein